MVGKTEPWHEICINTKNRFMKKFICVSILLFAGFSAFAQPNLACYRDTALVDEHIYKKDTVWEVKPVFRKGDWIIYYDFALTKVKAECHFDDNGNKTGVWKEFYKNGSQRFEWTYTGALVPLFPPGKEYYPNGKIKTVRMQNDTVHETQYYASGTASVENKWDKQGMWILHKEWCERGQLLINYNPTAAVPVAVKKYHCNGNLKAEYNWYTFGFTGGYKEYHENGKIAVEGQFTEKPVDQPMFMARKTGTWTYYDANGKMTKQEKWENGKLVSQAK